MSKAIEQGAASKSSVRMGRPSKRPNAKEYWETPLHAVLVKKMCDVEPAVVNEDRIDAKGLAKACGVARYTVYRWFQLDKLSPKAANKLISISKGNLTKEDMLPFLLD